MMPGLSVLKPPTPLAKALRREARPICFLAGSIEMGAAEAWQEDVERAFTGAAAVLLNPRRDDWDASWAQTLDNPLFREQVEWELDGLERADLVLMYFAPATRAPITLLELGLCARRGALLVCCPEGFWRKGNVDVVCARYGIEQTATLEALITAARARLRVPE